MAVVTTGNIILGENARLADPNLQRFLEQNFATIKQLLEQAGLGTGYWVPPTSSVGLPHGAVWNNAGVLTIVP